MKKFIYHLGLFVVLLFIVNVLLLNIGNDLYYKNYDKYALNFNNYLFSDSHGTSLEEHTQHFGVYNFSVNSDSYIDIKRKINFLLENTKLDTVYLSADEQMLSPYRAKLNNIDKSSFYATIYDYQTPFEYYKNELSQKVVYFQPKMGTVLRKYFVSKIENVFTASQPKKNLSEDIPSILNWSQTTIDSKEVIVGNRLKNQFYFKENSTLLEDALLEIISICKSNKITIIGVKFPLTKEYYSVAKDETFGVDSIFKLNKFKVLDFQSLYINNGDLFSDADHLNPKGGAMFADAFFKELQTKEND